MNEPRVRFFLDLALRERGVKFEPPKNGDAGFDLRSAEEITIPSGGQAIISTRLKLAIPTGWVGIIKDRSSMGSKRLYTHGGVIDSGYRGEVKIIISNGSSEPYRIDYGDKIAQMVILPCLVAAVQVDSEEELGETERSALGFGSSGTR